MDEEQRSDILKSFNKEQFIHENTTQISLSFLTVPKQFYGEVPYREDLTEESFFGPAKPEPTAIKTTSDLEQNSENKPSGSFQHYLEDVEQSVSKSPPLNFVENAEVSTQNQFGTNETSLNCWELNQFALFEDNFRSMPTGYTERNKLKENNWRSIFEEEQICRNFQEARKSNNKILIVNSY
jgi:hypothetical protein